MPEQVPPRIRCHLANKCEDIVNLQGGGGILVATRTAYYLCQGGSVFSGICLQNPLDQFDKIRWKDGTRAAEESARFWW